MDANIDPSASMASLVTLKAEVLNGSAATSPIAGKRRPKAVHEHASKESVLFSEEEEIPVQVTPRKKHADPFQLPMPAYGGYYCTLSDYLPSSDLPVVVCHR